MTLATPTINNYSKILVYNGKRKIRNTTIEKEAEADTDPRVDLAVEPTELALERTQLAWIRKTLAAALYLCTLSGLLLLRIVWSFDIIKIIQ